MIKLLLQSVSTLALTVTYKLKISSMIQLLLQSVSTDFSYETGVSTPGGLADRWQNTGGSLIHQILSPHGEIKCFNP
ncbi:hypothetical protein [Microcoleus sp. D3_18_C4]|uniref:hypothetical protein n=1 Tax=Microcoleus sp. D3_18_C4 TaxID=3055335 RepID=UPI002FD5AE79